MSSTCKSSSSIPTDDNIPERLELPSAIERIKSIRAANKKIKILHVWIWIRESPKLLELLILNGWASQLIRNIAAARLYAQQNNFHLVIHGVYYAEEVQRKVVHKESDAFGSLLNDLCDFSVEFNNDDEIVAAGDELKVITTEHLRLGEITEEVQKMINRIESEDVAVNGKRYQVVAWKEYGVDRTKSLKAFEEMTNNYRLLAKSASQVNPGKDVKINPAKEEERKAVKKRAAEIEKHCREKGTLPGDLRITFRRRTTKDVKDFIKQYSEAQKEMEQSSKTADGAVSSMLKSLYGNPTLSASPTGKAANIYMRTSPSTISSMIWIDITDGERMQVPLYQLCLIIAMLETQLGEHDGNMDVYIYYDHHQSREGLCNPEFGLFADSIFRQQVSLAVATKSNRVSSHLESFLLLQRICNEAGTKLLFAQQIGQDYEEIAIAEDKRRERQRDIIELFNEQMNILRNKLGYDDRERSLKFLSIARGYYSKSDKDHVIRILRESGFNDDFFDALHERDAEFKEKKRT